MKRALISVYKKNKKLLDFVNFLYKKKYKIISTDGTYKFLKKNGLHNIIKISDITSFPEILDGRIKTIHPNIYGGILANRTIKRHMMSIKNYNIDCIDIVVIDFYPFIEHKENKNHDYLIELIDIGGPSIIRAAAKNFLHVTPIVDNEDFELVINDIENFGYTSLKLRRKLAVKAFFFTSYYDNIIYKYLLGKDKFPIYFNLFFKKKMELCYGENPHQKAVYYSNHYGTGAMNNFQQLNGKQLSFNNIRDVDVAWKIVTQFTEPACCSVKHSTPCGAAIGKDIIEAFKKTYEADPISSFGSVIAINTTITSELAKEINLLFIDVIIAPDCEKNALKILKVKKKLRIIKINKPISDKTEYVQIDGGLLVQDSDYFFHDENNYKIVTKKNFSNEDKKSLLFANKVVKYVKSNAIVIAKGTQTLGISGGQTNRIWAASQAINRALKKKKKGLVLVSDAFFPFKDVIYEAAKSGEIRAILQPGGSIRDEESIKACDEFGISMAFTGIRYFKH
ncbi:bifunctional phosphoribosylaminoimidazolecarboxamide formyltransferase/IMP cyclohydrolase [Blattabacterium cuenoti]|uniref:bifunctional phosphoribosylaminoimidazolecarboxamide formyltransferase/IMP cyclohydrolase n=1 Tax=Blattabacterium cuenoti TaxID=1653831 RepID=UPI00163BFE47|nr:bifunctional phosphoribosylaminoimidazolecarboxamide formyltransferase/IMP cyclohydrolase [Blattabacterium cuenoti]